VIGPSTRPVVAGLLAPSESRGLAVALRIGTYPVNFPQGDLWTFPQPFPFTTREWSGGFAAFPSRSGEEPDGKQRGPASTRIGEVSVKGSVSGRPGRLVLG
jgi:hypothetical protein